MATTETVPAPNAFVKVIAALVIPCPFVTVAPEGGAQAYPVAFETSLIEHVFTDEQTPVDRPLKMHGAVGTLFTEPDMHHFSPQEII